MSLHRCIFVLCCEEYSSHLIYFLLKVFHSLYNIKKHNILLCIWINKKPNVEL